MKKAVVLIMVMILFLSYSRTFAQAPTEAELKMLQELNYIRSLLLEMKADIAELKKEIKEKQVDDNDDDDDIPIMGRFRTHRANSAKLRKIKLAKNPTEEQIKEYINKIAIASRGQNSFSSDDPQVSMLIKIGPENLKFLIESLGSSRRYGFGGGYHIKEAILKLAEDEHKKLIIELLPQNTFLVKVVLDRGWEKDAKAVLIEELSSTSQNLPNEWIQAVANLNDPKTYKDLKWFLVNQNNRSSTFKAIKNLPGIELEESVSEAWTEGTGQNEWERRSLAKIAIQYGHIDALEYLVDFLNNDSKNRWEMSDIRQKVLRHLKFYGSNKEIAVWLKKHEGKIVFDKKTKKFATPEDKK